MTTLGADDAGEIAFPLSACREAFQHAGESVARPPTQVLLRKRIHVHAIDGCKYSPAASRISLIDLRNAARQDGGRILA
jgi:hypothetical protein